MAEKKVTIVDKLAKVKAVLEGKAEVEEWMADFIQERIDNQNNKTANRKAYTDKKKAEENEPMKAKILEILEGAEEGLTATEILNAGQDVFPSVQKVTALVGVLKEEGKVEKVADKKRTLVKLKK